MKQELFQIMGLTISILVKQQAAMTEHISFHRDPKESDNAFKTKKIRLSQIGNNF